MGASIDYVLYEMPYLAFIECYNWIAMYKHGYKRRWNFQRERDEALKTKVWDEANGNFIDYVEEEKHRYVYVKERNCYMLPKHGD